MDRFNLKKDKQVVFESFSSDEVADSDVFGSNMFLGFDCQEICTSIVCMHSDWYLKMKVGKAFEKLLNMLSIVRHSNEFCFYC